MWICFLDLFTSSVQPFRLERTKCFEGGGVSHFDVKPFCPNVEGKWGRETCQRREWERVGGDLKGERNRLINSFRGGMIERSNSNRFNKDRWRETNGRKRE